MAGQRPDRLTGIDASFLANERRNAHMHIGAVMLFEGPPPAHGELIEHVGERLALIPRYRQKLAFPPPGTGRPLWVDDASFNLGYHIRHSALPAPGDERQLRELTARIFSQRLDRSKPLWELWLVEGLADGRFAVLTKSHHALVDGVGGVDIGTVLLSADAPAARRAPRAAAARDASARSRARGQAARRPPRSARAAADQPPSWTPRPAPSAAELALAGLSELVDASRDLVRRGLSALTHPGQTIDQALEVIEGIGEVAWAGLNRAPATPLNVPIGPHRRYAWVRAGLADVKAIKNSLGGTVNDVVLTVVTGALARFLGQRGVSTDGLELRAMVPVSVRTSADRDQLGNRLVALRGLLPVYASDPVARLTIVRAAMEGVKESKQAVGAEVLAAVQHFTPPTIMAQAARLNFSTRLFNLLVTNVPGPQFPLYLLRRELIDVFPVAFLPENQALAIAIISYNGKINFGLLADYDAIPDLDSVADGIQMALAELEAAARRR